MSISYAFSVLLLFLLLFQIALIQFFIFSQVLEIYNMVIVIVFVLYVSVMKIMTEKKYVAAINLDCRGVDKHAWKYQQNQLFTDVSQKSLFGNILENSPVFSVRKNPYSRSSHRRCFIKKLFLKFRNIFRKTPVLESLFNKFAGLQHRCFLVHIPKFFKNNYFE